MLSDEEKKEYEKIKYNNEHLYCDKKDVDYLLNLIEKQSKEIEHQIEKRANQKKELAILNAKQVEFNKLVNTLNSYKGQFKRQQKEIEVLKNKKPTFLIKDLYNPKLKEVKLQDVEGLIEQGREEIKAKIKAKIEEVDKDENASISDFMEYAKEYATQKLQSLLEKE